MWEFVIRSSSFFSGAHLNNVRDLFSWLRTDISCGHTTDFYLWLTKKGHYRVMLYLIIFCFLCFLLACVALAIFWDRDWFQSRLNSCLILLYPPPPIPQLHNLWLTKKGQLDMLLVFFCMVHYKRKWINSTVKQLICYILKSNKYTV